MIYGSEWKSRLISVDLAGATVAHVVGSREEPGLLLEALVRAPEKATNNEGYTRERFINEILFLDEASEIFNKEEFAAKFKAILEPTNGRFAPAFLPGVEISLKDYLIIAAGNQDITDEALKSRFIVLDFPTFKKTFLTTYLYKRICEELEIRPNENESFIELPGLPEENQKEIIALLTRETLTVRDIEQNMQNLVPLYSIPEEVRIHHIPTKTVDGFNPHNIMETQFQ